MSDDIRKDKKKRRTHKPGNSVDERENQLISAAVDLAEKQLLAGTASAQVIVHYLKLGTTREILEKEKLINENLLLSARTEAIKSQKKIEDLYLNALNAMRSYSGNAIESNEELMTDEDLDD